MADNKVQAEQRKTATRQAEAKKPPFYSGLETAVSPEEAFKRAGQPMPNMRPADLLQLQQTVGNQSTASLVMRHLQRRLQADEGVCPHCGRVGKGACACGQLFQEPTESNGAANTNQTVQRQPEQLPEAALPDEPQTSLTPAATSNTANLTNNLANSAVDSSLEAGPAAVTDLAEATTAGKAIAETGAAAKAETTAEPAAVESEPAGESAELTGSTAVATTVPESMASETGVGATTSSPAPDDLSVGETVAETTNDLAGDTAVVGAGPTSAAESAVGATVPQLEPGTAAEEVATIVRQVHAEALALPEFTPDTGLDEIAAPAASAATEQLPADNEEPAAVQLTVDPLGWARQALDRLRGQAGSKQGELRQAGASKLHEFSSQAESQKLGLLAQKDIHERQVGVSRLQAEATLKPQVAGITTDMRQATASKAGELNQIAGSKKQEAHNQLLSHQTALDDKWQSVNGNGQLLASNLQDQATTDVNEIETQGSALGLNGKAGLEELQKPYADKVVKTASDAGELVEALKIKGRLEGEDARGEAGQIWEQFVGREYPLLEPLLGGRDLMAERFQAGWQQLSERGQRLLENGRARLENGWQSVSQWGADLSNRITGAVGRVHRFATDTLADFARIGTTGWSALTNTLSQAATGARQFLQTSLTTFTNFAATTAGRLGSFVQNGLRGVGQIGQTIGASFRSLVSTAVNGVSGSGGSIRQVFGSVVRSLVDGVRNVGQTSATTLLNAIRQGTDLVRTTAANAGASLNRVIGSARQQIQNTIESARSGIQNVAQAARQAFDNTRRRLTDAIGSAITAIRERIQAIGERLRQAWQNLRDELSRRFQALRQRLREAIERTLNFARRTWQTLRDRWTAFRETIRNTWNRIKQMAANIVFTFCPPLPRREVNERPGGIPERPELGEGEWQFDPSLVVNEQMHGADTPQLGGAMRELSHFIERGNRLDQLDSGQREQLERLLRQLAQARNMSYEDALRQYSRALDTRSEAIRVAEEANKDMGYERPSEGAVHANFWGSSEQLAFGRIVGDNLGLDPAFASLLSPTGGLVGPDATALHMRNSAVGFHGIAHDAAGYLHNYHQIGPGYEYRDVPAWDPTGVLDTSNPLAGQVSGIHYWQEYLKGTEHEGRLAHVEPELMTITVAGIPVSFYVEAGVTSTGGLSGLDTYMSLRCNQRR